MKKKFLLLIFLLAGAYYLWTQIFGFEQKIPPPPAVTASPLEQVEAVLSQNPISAESLHSIYLKFPELVRKQLRNRTISITGKIEDILVTGLQKQRAEFAVSGLTLPKIILVFDLDTHKHFADVQSEKGMFLEKSGGRLYVMKEENRSVDLSKARVGWLTSVGGGVGGMPRVVKEIARDHFFTVGMTLEQPCRLKTWSTSSLYFFFEPKP